jgi:DNA-binding transcriptional LysR family regulator
MHNRAIVDRALGADGPPPKPAIETNALLTLTLCVSAGSVCAVLPAPMIAAVRSHGELEALPLVDPDIRPPIGFVALAGTQPSRALQAALQLLDDAEWREQLELHTRSSFDS